MVIIDRVFFDTFESWTILGYEGDIKDLYLCRNLDIFTEFTVWHDIKKDTWSGVVVEFNHRRKLEQEEFDKIKKFLKEEGY